MIRSHALPLRIANRSDGKRSSFSRSLVGATLVVSLLAGCTGSSEDPVDNAADSTAEPAETAAQTQSGPGLEVPADAVEIDYFVAKGPAPLLKETLLPLAAPTSTVSMLVNNITYAGVVCGFSFTGTERPVPPVVFRFQIEGADGKVVDASVDVGWTGDDEQAGSAAVDGWNFLSDAQVNRNGPGWVVQVGAIPAGGGQGKAVPKRALCSLTSPAEMPTTVGPIAYWAGFATV
jgi:hypothetical protein